MSAFEVSDTHIDALLSAGLFYDPGNPVRWFRRALTPEEKAGTYEVGAVSGPEALRLVKELTETLTLHTSGRVGAMLRLENRRSVNHRYAETEDEAPYVFTKLGGVPNPVVVLKAIDCYEYQSCEHPDWRWAEAFAFCEALRRRMIGQLPGYDQAPWEIVDKYVFCPEYRNS